MSDPSHAPAPAGGEKKGLNWGLPFFILILCICAGFGIAFMMEALFGVRNAIDWFVSLLFRLLGPILILAIAFYMMRSSK